MLIMRVTSRVHKHCKPCEPTAVLWVHNSCEWPIFRLVLSDSFALAYLLHLIHIVWPQAIPREDLCGAGKHAYDERKPTTFGMWSAQQGDKSSMVVITPSTPCSFLCTRSAWTAQLWTQRLGFPFTHSQDRPGAAKSGRLLLKHVPTPPLHL